MLSCRRWIAILGLSLLAWQAQAGEYVTVLHFNDFHGHLLPDAPDKQGVSRGGLARMATMVAETRAYNSKHGIPTLLLEAGDVLQGTPLSSTFKGDPDFQCLNLMGVEAMTFGNHEFDFGLDNLLLRIKQARFPLRSASVRRTATGELVTPNPVTYLQLGGIRAAIIPLTTPETKVESAAKNVAGLDFEEPADTLRRLLPEIRPRADFLIALNHLGLEADRKLARDVPELDVIIGGHSHDALNQPERIGQTLICQAGSYGQYLGQLDAFVADGAVDKYRGFLRAVDQRTRPEPRVAAVVNRYASQLEAKMAVVVGETTVPLEGTRQIIRTQETNLGNLVADAMREYAQADLTLTNAGGIRASIGAGPITVGEVLTVLPFDNEIFSVELTGAQILGVLQRLAALPKEDGGFLQVSGLSFALGPGQVSDVQVGGRPLEADKVYRVATIDFLITGGNGYTAFTAGRNARGLKATPSEAFTAYLKAHRPVAPAVEGRIQLTQ